MSKKNKKKKNDARAITSPICKFIFMIPFLMAVAKKLPILHIVSLEKGYKLRYSIL